MVVAAALFLKAKNWKQAKCLSTSEWMGNIIIRAYNGILFSNEWSKLGVHDVHESQNDSSE